MKEFYSERKAGGWPVPCVLGLTASPVIRSDIASLQTLEATLDAVCRSPTKHREELLLHSQRPSLVTVPYSSKTQFSPADYTTSIERLSEARNKLDIMEDPYILSLVAEKTERAKRKLKDAIDKKKTYIQDSMKAFCRRSIEIAMDLGSWAADYYIYETIRRFLAGIVRQGAISQSYNDAEVVYLARIFQDANIHPPRAFEPSDLSDKAQRLVDVLLKHEGDAKGIIL